jgi:hypothetical protein
MATKTLKDCKIRILDSDQRVKEENDRVITSEFSTKGFIHYGVDPSIETVIQDALFAEDFKEEQIPLLTDLFSEYTHPFENFIVMINNTRMGVKLNTRLADLNPIIIGKGEEGYIIEYQIGASDATEDSRVHKPASGISYCDDFMSPNSIYYSIKYGWKAAVNAYYCELLDRLERKKASDK